MIRRLLVANRAESARRVLATCHRVGIETVAVYSDPDADAPHVAEADWAVHLPGNAPTATYLRGDLLVSAARRTGADALHPGWGFLAASPDFAAAVAAAGLTWVGPAAKTIALLADKPATAGRLAAAGVPVLPRWEDPTEVTEFPVLVKPARGDGGRGIRLARDPAELAEAVASARRAAADRYGDGTVYCERYLARARHLDLQVVVDADGNVATFGERECSVQRRHQPLLAESPSPAVAPELRAELTAAAIRAVHAVGYVGAGTVEFLLAPGGGWYVLEVSPRLPPEHAVTECATGVDLVRLQLLVAEGAPLPAAGEAGLTGHAIAVQLRAEDPGYAWLPSTGTLHRFELADSAGDDDAGLRLDTAAAAGATLSVHYDSTLATLVAWSPTRYEAARLLAATLARARIHGVVTNRDLLVRVLRNPAFLTGAVDTGFLADHPEVFAPLLSSVEAVRLSCLAAALAAAAARRATAPALASAPSGWRNVPSGVQTVVYRGPSGHVEIGYRLGRDGDLIHWWVRAVALDELDLAGLGQPNSLPDDHPPVAVVAVEPELVVLDVTGVRVAFAVHRVDDLSYVDSPEGSVVLVEVPRYPVGSTLDETAD